MSTPQKTTTTTQFPQLQAVTTTPVATAVSIPQPASTRTGGVQVQVLSAQSQSQTPSQSQTQGSSNGTSSVLSSNPATALLTGIGAQEIQAQLAQLRALQLPPEQQRQLLIAAQLQAQHLKSSTISAASLPASASIVLQPATLQGLTVVTTTPATTTTKSSGQFVSQYPADTATFASTQPPILSQQQLHVVQSTGYYDTSTLPQLQPGLGGFHHTTQDHLGPITHTTRAHPQTIQWLFENYETAEGVSLPRSTLYNHYLRHCAANKIDAVNAASFGKLIRSVFIGLKTRRLGTRGNSKYHYYGIRIKPESALNAFPQEDSPAVAMRQPSHSSQRDYPEAVSEGGEGSSQPELTPQQQHQQYLGESRPELPSFPEIDWADTNIPDTVTADDVGDFTALYREHCEAILDVVVNLQFQMVENLWHHFWNDKPSSVDEGADDDGDQNLPQEKLLLLTSCHPVVEYINTCDHTLYQCIVDFLIPNVLHPIPGTLTQAIRNFAKSLESWLAGSLEGYNSTLTKSKVCAVVAFSQTLRRYTSLNHLAQAARAVLQNASQIGQMLSDLNRVDFGNVQEQASWVCECDEGLVSKLEQDFKNTLEQHNTLEQWATWLERVCNTVLKPYEGGPQFSKAARQFLLKWSFYSSIVIRDLTLRSAASFGSFHLIRLLYDEYMFFLIEHKVAKEAGKTPIAVMTEFAGNYRGAFPEEGDFGNQSLPQEAQDIDKEPQAKRRKL